MTKTHNDEALRRRAWVRRNFDWFMNEVSFHRDMKDYFKNEKHILWLFDQNEGKVNPYETPQRSD